MEVIKAPKQVPYFTRPKPRKGQGYPMVKTSRRTHGYRGLPLTMYLPLLQDLYLSSVVEVLQSIKQSDMSPILSRIYSADGGPETLDVLMKYL